MIVNICVWDAQFSTACQTSSGPLTPWLLPSPAFTECSPPLFILSLFSFAISQYVDGYSLHQLTRPPNSRTRKCTHKHMSALQKPDI